jgi:ABC-2 type transport system permease protein
MLAAQFRYQVLLMVRSPRAMVMGLVIPVLLLALGSSRARSGPAAAADVLAGAAVFGLIVTSYVSHAAGLVASREEGVLRRWRATPLPAWCFFAGKIAATMLLALASVAVAMLAAAALFKVSMTGDAVASLAVTFALGAAACAAVGTAVTAWIPSTQSAVPLLMITYMPVILFSGGFGSAASDPHWVNTMLSYFPAQPLIDAATAALRQAGGGLVWLSGRDAAVLAAWAMAAALASVWFFRWDSTRPRHSRAAAIAASRPAGSLSPGGAQDADHRGAATPGARPSSTGAAR